MEWRAQNYSKGCCYKDGAEMWGSSWERMCSPERAFSFSGGLLLLQLLYVLIGLIFRV